MPLQIVREDITKMHVDAIVNTTNERMVGLSGVDLAVHTAAGAELDEECSRLAPLGVGEAKLSGGYGLPAKYVIHTSGPVWHGGLVGERLLLRSCYLESLRLAVGSGCESVAFPLISSGNYGYPKDQVLRFAVETITEFLFDHELMVYLCVFDRESYTFSQTLFQDLESFIRYEPPAGRAQKRSEFSVAARAAIPVDLSEQPFSLGKAAADASVSDSLRAYLQQMDRGFREMLFDLIDERGMTDVECYKRANVDKRTFSKIKSNKEYKPSKQTAVAFAIALKLSLEETQSLLATAGFTLSNSKPFDRIIRYFILHENYNTFEINEALFEFDQPLIGGF